MRTGKIDGRKLYFMLPTALDYLWIWAKIESEKGKTYDAGFGHDAATQKITRIYNRILFLSLFFPSGCHCRRHRLQFSRAMGKLYHRDK